MEARNMHCCFCKICKGRNSVSQATIRRHYLQYEGKSGITLKENEARALPTGTALFTRTALPPHTVVDPPVGVSANVEPAGEGDCLPTLDLAYDNDFDEAIRMADNEERVAVLAYDENENNEMNEEPQAPVQAPSIDLELPLYDGSATTVRQAIRGYVSVFLSKATSKQALTELLTHTKSILPQPNLLPASYKELLSLTQHETITINKKHTCINECMFFYGNEDYCTHCNEPRYKQPDAIGRRFPRKMFSHISLKEVLEKLFGCSNISQIIQEAGGCQPKNLITDITETATWQQWKSIDEDLKVIIGLNTDGVSPFDGGQQYSCWPILISIMNLPKHIRTKTDALILYGVAPSKNGKDGSGIEPDLIIYQQLMVDELLTLSSAPLQVSYRDAPLQVKVELLLYMLDFQGYAKYFRMTGAVSMLPCNICLIRSHQVPTSRTGFKRAIQGHANYGNPELQRDCVAEMAHRRLYAQQPTNLAKSQHAQLLGVKQVYPDMALPYHHRVTHTAVDAMHCIKDVVHNILDVVRGKKTFHMPILELSKHSLSVADQRFNCLVIPSWIDLCKQPRMFTSPKGMKSHDYKQLVHHHIIQYCLEGLIDDQQSQTKLFRLLDCISVLCSEVVDTATCKEETRLMKEALIEFEVPFKLLMNVTTHLLVHLAEQRERFGPPHSTWLFSYERFNSWLSRAIKNRAFPEATVMETYRLQEWYSRTVIDRELDGFLWDRDESPIQCKHIGDLKATTLTLQEMDMLCQAAGVVHEPEVAYQVNVAGHVRIQTGGRRATHRSYKVNKLSVVQCEGDTLAVKSLFMFKYKYYSLCYQMQVLRREDTRFPKFVESGEVLIKPVEALSKPLIYHRGVDGLYTVLNGHVI